MKTSILFRSIFVASFLCFTAVTFAINVPKPMAIEMDFPKSVRSAAANDYYTSSQYPTAAPSTLRRSDAPLRRPL